MSDLVRDFGLLTLGSRLRRAGERLQADTQRIVDEAGLKIQSSQFPFLAAIDRQGPMTVGELAQAVGITQPGVTRAVAQLADLGLLKVNGSPGDQRLRVIALSEAGERLVEFAKANVWPRIEAAVADLCKDLSGPLLAQLAAIEEGLEAKPLVRRAATAEATP